eukprot:gene8348-9201_t
MQRLTHLSSLVKIVPRKVLLASNGRVQHRRLFHALAVKATLPVSAPLTSTWFRSFSTTEDRPKVPFTANLVAFLESKRRRYLDIETELSKAENFSNSYLAELGKEMSQLGNIVSLMDKRDEYVRSIAELKAVEEEELAKGPEGEEMVTFARNERADIEKELSSVESDIIRFLAPKDADDDRNIVLEVRAGTGGDEASLFAGEVFRMYQKFAFVMKWKWEELSLTRTEIGGFKEAQALISGESVFKYLKHESGVHRVQRIPVNDTKIQTSAASVIVIPEADDVDVDIRPGDIRVDVFRSGGAGGQSVNKTESAVRMTHIPTGVVVVMQDERSQIQNRAKAMQVLRSRVYDLERSRRNQAMAELRSAAHGTGDRNDKIRTYNFPQDRVTDHRAGVTVPSIERVMNGEALTDIVDKLNELEESSRIAQLIEQINR